MASSSSSVGSGSSSSSKMHWRSESTAVAGQSALLVAVVSPHDNPALHSMPTGTLGVDFVVGNTVEEFLAEPRLGEVQAVVFVPPASPNTLKDLVEHIPGLKWAHCFFAGVDSLSPIMPRLAAKSVPLTNGRGAFSGSLAEYVMAATLHFNKQIPLIQKNLTERKWDKFVMPTLEGKTIGFLGYGHIAQTSARVAREGFGMRIAAVRRNATKPCAVEADIVFSPEDKLACFAESDFVVSVLPGTPETLDFCGQAEFAAMKQGAVFISIGRGVAVDEEALAAALKRGDIAGAAIDVFKVEPLPQSSPLWECGQEGRLLLTAHNADYTAEYFDLGWEVWAQNHACFVSGRAFETPVDLISGY